jgi:hypothetical protein
MGSDERRVVRAGCRVPDEIPWDEQSQQKGVVR